MKKSFPPIINQQSRILILGTMPGEESLRQHQYYAHPRNQFWHIIGEVYQTDLATAAYVERKAFLLAQGLALWDVLESCERIGSLDKDIKNIVVNDFETFFEHHQNLRTIVFNGQAAHQWFEQHVVKPGKVQRLCELKKHVMPSTSPAATKKVEEKILLWREITQA